MLDKFDGIIIAGSAQFDITKLPDYLSHKLEDLKPAVLELIENNKNVLGIWYGRVRYISKVTSTITYCSINEARIALTLI